jgi:hypothetical protein
MSQVARKSAPDWKATKYITTKTPKNIAPFKCFSQMHFVGDFPQKLQIVNAKKCTLKL